MSKNTPIRLVMFDMAGTTVRDNNEVLLCFSQACQQEGLITDEKRLNALMGVSKLEVFNILWREALGEGIQQQIIETQAQHSFLAFRKILEHYYRSNPVVPTDGALEVFEWLRQKDIKVALNTGFYRIVTNIILNKLGWLAGLDSQYVGGVGTIIDFSIASDEVPQGRPEPYMIQKAMGVFGITDPKQVVKVGDTPVDLAEGRNAGCAASLGVVNGTHSRAELEVLDNDGLLGSISELPDWLEHHLMISSNTYHTRPEGYPQ
ncbi:MAG: HAD hydrolase-like protein [Saprospiraceae bacterium]|nr:HAD hydrolase-like protein [Saprospiraceae bacterium]